EARKNVAQRVSAGVTALSRRQAPEGAKDASRLLLRPSGADPVFSRGTQRSRAGLHSSAPPALSNSPSRRSAAQFGCASRAIWTALQSCRRLVMHVWQIPQLVRLLFRQSVAKEIASADFRACKIFQEARLAKRRLELNVKMKPVVDFAVRGGMM